MRGSRSPPRPRVPAPLLAALLLLLLPPQATCAAAAVDEGIVASGDTVFLWGWSGRTVDIEIDTAKARFNLRGNWQALQIEKVMGDGGAISGGDAVILNHTGVCLGVDVNQEVHARPADPCQTWQILRQDGGNSQIHSGDSVHFRMLGEPRYLDYEGDPSDLVRARWDETGTWQTFRLERELPAAVKAGDAVTLALAGGAGAKVDVQGEQVRVRWQQAGFLRALFQESDENVGPWMHAFTIYGGGGRGLWSGDTVNFWAFTGKCLDAGEELIQARYTEALTWQTFTIQKDGGGPIMQGDEVAFQAHTGLWVEVQDHTLKAVGQQVESAGRFAIGAYAGPATPTDLYRQISVTAVLCVAACAILTYELYWSSAAKRAAGRLAVALGRSSDAAAGISERPSQAAAGAPRLEALDAPRWLASAQIVASHFYGFEWGALWTQFFFVLSGFVLAYSELSKPPDQGPRTGVLRYVARRLSTLYPTFLFALSMSAVQWNHSAFDWLTLPFHIFLMHAWFPITYKRMGEAPWRWIGLQWVAVSWFISVLVPFWVLLRPLANRARGFSKQFCIATLLSLWAFSLVPWAIGNKLLVEKLGCDVDTERCWASAGMGVIYHGPLGSVHIFASGVVLARLFILTSMRDAETGDAPAAATERLSIDWARAPIIFRYGVCIGYAPFILLVALVKPAVYEDHRYFFHNGGLLPVMLLILAGGALGRDPIAKYLFQNQVFKLLGRISYAQYLLQYNVYYLFLPLFPDGASAVSYQVVFPIALFVASYLVERLVTRVGVEWLKSGGRGGKRDGAIGAMAARCGERPSSEQAHVAKKPVADEEAGSNASLSLKPAAPPPSTGVGEDAKAPKAGRPSGAGAGAGGAGGPPLATAAAAAMAHQWKVPEEVHEQLVPAPPCRAQEDEGRPLSAVERVPPLAFRWLQHPGDTPPISEASTQQHFEAPPSGSSTWRRHQARPLALACAQELHRADPGAAASAADPLPAPRGGRPPRGACFEAAASIGEA